MIDFNLRTLEREAVRQALAYTGHVEQAARLLGVTTKTAYNMVRRHGLALPHPEHSRRRRA